nr:hypothetical protein [Frigoribacterium sp. PvP032]
MPRPATQFSTTEGPAQEGPVSFEGTASLDGTASAGAA